MRTLKRIYSVSELETFNESPEKYRAQYVLKRPTEPVFGRGNGLSAATRGDIIHKMIEYHGKGVTVPQRLLDNVRIELEAGDITPEEKSDILGQFKNFLNSRFASVKDARCEVPFLMRVGDDHIDGKLDMLITDGSRPWEIVDFKTGEAFDPGESAKKYEFQMHAYALAVAKATGIARGLVTLFFVSGGEGKEYQETIDRTKLERIEARAAQTIEKIRT
jgi:RecB family exonuclease